MMTFYKVSWTEEVSEYDGAGFWYGDVKHEKYFIEKATAKEFAEEVKQKDHTKDVRVKELTAV